MPKLPPPIVGNASWFKAVSTFRREACKTRLRLGCSAKLALLKQHGKAPEA